MKRSPIYTQAARLIAEGEMDQICYALTDAAVGAGINPLAPTDMVEWNSLNRQADYYISEDGYWLKGAHFGMPKTFQGPFPKAAREHRVMALLMLAAMEEADGN